MKQAFSFLLFFPLLLIPSACKKSEIEIQGHRGCRGYWPENSIYGMLEAIKQGVDVLEMDVVVSKDLEIVLSHEPFFHHEICLDPNGNLIYESTQEAYNIYEFTYEQIRNTRCGTFPHPRFPLQKQKSYYKPTLSEVIDTVEKVSKHLNKLIRYNIEIKARDEWNGIFHPDYRAFADLVAGVIYRHGITEITTVQSFHIPTLQYLHHAHPSLKLVLLVDEDEDLAKKYKQLGFTPDVLSPHYSHVSVPWIKFAESRGMKLITWTVNDAETAIKLVNMGVHGIITDYPDSIHKAVKNK
ncbi:MAG: glycerophosphodiester phosphodiesterase family protein [Thermaurantimonas sp.]|uniref:glycerophosphodiester phosphodiesterase family protein n=1 Tax=Thermaurantimonas sp. TaxID=2681568 RepID=UPI0039197D22